VDKTKFLGIIEEGMLEEEDSGEKNTKNKTKNAVKSETES
jgi:hypothetical protein